MALWFIKRLIHRKAIVFYYSVFRSALNATAPFKNYPVTTLNKVLPSPNACSMGL